MRRLYFLAAVAAVVALCTGQKCPTDLGPNGVTFIPYPGNCMAYYRCTKLGKSPEHCPSYGDLGPLCYNDKLKICDWTANVPCCNPFLPDPGDSPGDNPGDNPGNNPGDNPGHNPGGKCPNFPKQPHSSCLKYIDDGTSHCCGINWAFNPKLCLCDLLSNVKSCQPSETQKRECNFFAVRRVSLLTRLADLVYGDNQTVALNDDSFGAPSAK